MKQSALHNLTEPQKTADRLLDHLYYHIGDLQPRGSSVFAVSLLREAQSVECVLVFASMFGKVLAAEPGRATRRIHLPDGGSVATHRTSVRGHAFIFHILDPSTSCGGSPLSSVRTRYR